MTTRALNLLMSAAALAAVVTLAAAWPADAAAAASKVKKRVAEKSVAVAKVRPRRTAASSRHRGSSLVRPGPLYNGPDYLGDDPDPHIRFELMRELSARYGGVD